MAAGLGFKDFTTGEVLTAADVDGYLMQGIWVFASAAARDAAVTSPQEGNFAFLKDTNTTTYYTGSAWTNLDTTGMVNPMTTTGDTIYASSGSTPARLGIGSTGQVLTVSGGVPSWATPTSGAGLVHINTTSFSNVATQDVDSVFTTTYKSYLIVINSIYAATAANDLLIAFRYGSSTQTINYYGYQQYINYLGTITTSGQNAANNVLMSQEGGTSTFKAAGHLYVFGVGTSGTDYVRVTGQFQASNDHGGSHFASFNEFARSYTGFRLLSSSSNITGSVSTYGLANA